MANNVNSVLALGLAGVAGAGCAHETAPAHAEPIILRRGEVMERAPDSKSDRAIVWTMRRSGHARTNLVEMSGKLSYHLHPDAEHTLLVLKGSVCAWTGTKAVVLEEGDYISIPPGVPHKYETVTKKALLLSFDAPAYDPAKTVTVSEEGVAFEPNPASRTE